MHYGVMVALLGSLIFLHELGHFGAARLSGLPVARFSLGLGPVLWRVRLGGTEYCLSAIPFGGYVLLDLADPAAYLRQPLAARLFFAVSGPLANVLVALACYVALDLMTRGAVWPLSVLAPLAAIWRDLQATIGALGGVLPHVDQINGVVGIVVEGGRFVGQSIPRALFLAARISLSLAVFNLLPLPPLDGGKMVFDILERLNRSLSRLYVPSAVCGWIVLAAFMVYVTVKDVWHYVL